jgi:membrane fusion protein, copper/silver efflux system
MKTFITILITALLAVGGTWLAQSHSTPQSTATAERKPLFYQSPMHPWIKSDKPGRCTICGMELTPIYPGEKALEATGGENIVALSSSQIQVLGVQTVDAKIQPLVRTLQVAGMIDDDERRHRIISAYVDGRVDKLFANHHGAEVTAGTPLAEIYSPELLQAEREYRQLNGELKRNTALRLRQMGLTDLQIEALTDKPIDALDTQILASLSGTVVEHEVYEGQYVKTGDKLFAIADFSIMWFQFQAYEQDLPWISVGQVVTVTTPSKPGKSFEGKITFIDPNFDEATRSTKVRVELANPLVEGRRELLHKLYAEGSVKMDAPAVLTVPRSSIIQSGPEAVVYVDQDGGAYAQTPVKIGRRGDTLVEVLSGVKAGDKVVTTGNLLIDGQAEMNRAFMPPATEPMEDSLTPPQQQAIQNFIHVADAMAAALAADDLTTFTKASEPAMTTTASLTESLASIPSAKANLTALDAARHFHGSADLKSARAAFHKFSQTATAVLEPLRRAKGFPELQIWECPMADQAIPGAPKKARWIQTNGRPGQNPFFGADMIDCGKEIKP